MSENKGQNNDVWERVSVWYWINKGCNRPEGSSKAKYCLVFETPGSKRTTNMANRQ